MPNETVRAVDRHQNKKCPTQMRSKLTDIARKAGVSTATVDRVLNNRGGVRDRTVEIVMEAARQLEYLLDSVVEQSTPEISARVVFRPFYYLGV